MNVKQRRDPTPTMVTESAWTARAVMSASRIENENPDGEGETGTWADDDE